MKAIRDASPQAGHVEMNTFIRSGDRSTRCLDLYLCIDGRRYFHDEGRGREEHRLPPGHRRDFQKGAAGETQSIGEAKKTYRCRTSRQKNECRNSYPLERIKQRFLWATAKENEW